MSDKIVVDLSPFKDRFQKQCNRMGQSMTSQIKLLVMQFLKEHE